LNPLPPACHVTPHPCLNTSLRVRGRTSVCALRTQRVCCCAPPNTPDTDAGRLSALHKEHAGYEGDATTGKQLLAKLRQRLLMDMFVIGLGFVFFMCVVVSIWYRRFF
jgi:hypothetical protein